MGADAAYIYEEPFNIHDLKVSSTHFAPALIEAEQTIGLLNQNQNQNSIYCQVGLHLPGICSDV